MSVVSCTSSTTPEAVGLFSGLLQMRLYQGSKGDIWLIKQTIQGFGLFPGLHLGRQRTQMDSPPVCWPLVRLVWFDAYRAKRGVSAIA